MKIKDIIVESPIADIKKEQQLNQRQYRKLVSRLKSHGGAGGDKVAKNCLRDLMKRWKQGDRLTSNYKKMIKGLNINTRDVFK